MFEKLIVSCLQVIGQAKLSYYELLTTVGEAEPVIHSRPPTYILWISHSLQLTC
jgi:hypothetical protein